MIFAAAAIRSGNGASRKSTESRLLQTAMLLDPKRTSCRKSAVSDVLVCAALALGWAWGGETSLAALADGVTS